MMRVDGSRVPTPHMASPKLHGTLFGAKNLKRHPSQHVPATKKLPKGSFFV